MNKNETSRPEERPAITTHEHIRLQMSLAVRVDRGAWDGCTIGEIAAAPNGQEWLRWASHRRADDIGDRAAFVLEMVA